MRQPNTMCCWSSRSRARRLPTSATLAASTCPIRCRRPAREVIEAPIRGRFSASADEVKNTRDQTVMVAVVEQTARERAQEAVKLRDQGKHPEAAKLFQQNVDDIQTVQGTFARPSKALDGLQRQYEAFSKTAPAAPASQLM